MFQLRISLPTSRRHDELEHSRRVLLPRRPAQHDTLSRVEAPQFASSAAARSENY
jgi:hypothetical protein